MTALSFESGTIPAKARIGRTPLPNPFMDRFPSDTETIVFTVEQGRNSVEARRSLRQIRQAAKACDRSGRAQMTDLPNGGVRFEAWTVARVSRKGTEAPAPAKAPAKKAAAKKTTAARKR